MCFCLSVFKKTNSIETNFYKTDYTIDYIKIKIHYLMLPLALITASIQLFMDLRSHMTAFERLSLLCNRDFYLFYIIPYN